MIPPAWMSPFWTRPAIRPSLASTWIRLATTSTACSTLVTHQAVTASSSARTCTLTRQMPTMTATSLRSSLWITARATGSGLSSLATTTMCGRTTTLTCTLRPGSSFAGSTTLMTTGSCPPPARSTSERPLRRRARLRRRCWTPSGTFPTLTATSCPPRRAPRPRARGSATVSRTLRSKVRLSLTSAFGGRSATPATARRLPDRARW
mmetsp:Transcript_171001/g.415573  ORF Transcript_171001/g.415573 Transcript_171001/m.415573 type:complete len:207 (-) Transcript_171001:5-625(-)